jgi:hypothetical protein
MTVSVWIKKYDNTAISSAFWVESPSSPATEGFQASVPDPTTGEEIINFDVGGNTPDDSELGGPITGFAGFTGASWWNSWHHWVFVKNGTTKQIWIDGQLFLEGTGATLLPTDFTKIWLGAGGGLQGGALLNMHGLIDDFAIFGTALTQAEIQQLFTGTAPSALPASTKPLAYWDFSAAAVIGPGPALTIGRSGNAITISWPASAGFRLRSSATVNGTYADVPGVTGNSYTVNNPTNTQFYRLQSN